LRYVDNIWLANSLLSSDLHPNRAGWYSIYRPRKDERLSWPSWIIHEQCSYELSSIVATIFLTNAIRQVPYLWTG